MSILTKYDFRKVTNFYPSGLIGLINDTIDTPRRLTCVSRPRRFGKSFAAQMLCAYYDKTCDSSKFFDDLEIAANDAENYQKYRNQFDVIYLDITNIMGEAGGEELTGNKFIMIIDKWDAPIRETPDVQKLYLAFLRTLFKSSGTTARIFAAVYMTGILPVKKDGMIEDA